MIETLNQLTIDLDMETLPLEEAQKVRLMNRVDKKYWFNISYLSDLLKALENDYYIQTINSKQWQQYATQYFDTADSKMYTLHHNGKLNRYKIRHREYMDTHDHFLEVKFKSNKGRTIKKRIPSEDNPKEFTEKENAFIGEKSIFSHEQLQPSLRNSFYRLTCINKDYTERCTIDTGICFKSDIKEIAMKDLVILEIKSEKGQGTSVLQRYLRDARIKPAGFSKYCIGSALTDPDLKRNRFKQKIRNIGKVINMPDLYNM